MNRYIKQVINKNDIDEDKTIKIKQYNKVLSVNITIKY